MEWHLKMGLQLYPNKSINNKQSLKSIITTRYQYMEKQQQYTIMLNGLNNQIKETEIKTMKNPNTFQQKGKVFDRERDSLDRYKIAVYTVQKSSTHKQL